MYVCMFVNHLCIHLFIHACMSTYACMYECDCVYMYMYGGGSVSIHSKILSCMNTHKQPEFN